LTANDTGNLIPTCRRRGQGESFVRSLSKGERGRVSTRVRRAFPVLGPSFPHPIQRPRTTDARRRRDHDSQPHSPTRARSRLCPYHRHLNIPTAVSGPQTDEQASKQATNQLINRLLSAHAHAPYRTKRNQTQPPAYHRPANHQLRDKYIQTPSQFALRTTT
jgi:hypothetical protein